MAEEFEGFLNNRNLIFLIDALAQRYGITPSEILNQMSIFEFSLNMAVMTIAEIERGKRKDNPDVKYTTLDAFGIGRDIKKG